MNENTEIFEELEESELGTQDYWTNRYTSELKNFQRNRGDVGEIWFGEDIVERIIKYLENSENADKNQSIIDVGCGNGMLLIELAKIGYKNLFGVDYCQNAINLAEKIAKEYSQAHITYKTCDILNDNIEETQYDKVLDKGTYDAISLMENPKKNREVYIEKIGNCLKSNGLLIITSCNWTQEELLAQFAGKFELQEAIPTPQFKFGGKVGNVVTSIVLKKCYINMFTRL